MQGSQQFETDVKVEKPGCCIVVTKYCFLFQNNFHLPLSLFKRMEGSDFFAGGKICIQKEQGAHGPHDTYRLGYKWADYMEKNILFPSIFITFVSWLFS